MTITLPKLLVCDNVHETVEVVELLNRLRDKDTPKIKGSRMGFVETIGCPVILLYAGRRPNMSTILGCAKTDMSKDDVKDMRWDV